MLDTTDAQQKSLTLRKLLMDEWGKKYPSDIVIAQINKELRELLDILPRQPEHEHAVAAQTQLEIFTVGEVPAAALQAAATYYDVSAYDLLTGNKHIKNVAIARWHIGIALATVSKIKPEYKVFEVFSHNASSLYNSYKHKIKHGKLFQDEFAIELIKDAIIKKLEEVGYEEAPTTCIV